MVMSIDAQLAVTYTTKVISQVAAASNKVMRAFEMQGGAPGSNVRGRNVRTVGHRSGGYDIYNDSRQVGRSTYPGAPAAVSKRNPVGRVNYTIPRMHDSLILPAEELHNRRVLGGSSSVFDEQGASYIAAQQRTLGQRAGNFRSLLIGGMLRGALYAHVSGDGIYYDYTSTTANHTIDWQIPSGNKSQLNMLGAGNIIDISWDNPGANIPNHFLQVNAAFENLTGSRLELVIMNSYTWNLILNNDYVIQNAGSSGPAYTTYTRSDDIAENSKPNVTFVGAIKATPWVEIMVTDELLVLDNSSGTTTKTQFLENGKVWFGPKPTPDLMEMLEGDEPIAEGPNMAWSVKSGLAAWSYTSWNPTSRQLFVLDNALPALYIPSATAYGSVTF